MHDSVLDVDQKLDTMCSQLPQVVDACREVRERGLETAAAHKQNQKTLQQHTQVCATQPW